MDRYRLAHPPVWLIAVTLRSMAVIWLSFVAHQVLSWPQATGEHRQQLKWLASGAAVAIGLGLMGRVVLLATRVLPRSSLVAVAGATLVAAALFSPLRHRVQRIVNRRFNRARYDTEVTVAAFAAHMKDAVDLDSIRDDLASVVQNALEPVHIAVWLNQRD